MQRDIRLQKFKGLLKEKVDGNDLVEINHPDFGRTGGKKRLLEKEELLLEKEELLLEKDESWRHS